MTGSLFEIPDTGKCFGQVVAAIDHGLVIRSKDWNSLVKRLHADFDHLRGHLCLVFHPQLADELIAGFNDPAPIQVVMCLESTEYGAELRDGILGIICFGIVAGQTHPVVQNGFILASIL
ncbi:hypothetical protein DIS24_g9126 [Lasiodiplodia hormozganensis]|uniref:Uncharacterized protein n=1 Tax=Lasiodiplodia hormozganensis TaxID=869390 RepID=A0AA39XZC7_9PEZI|nr:hypothetical protein DIS24_g9126 [Lasiodiplodia hormozganensis]